MNKERSEQMAEVPLFDGLSKRELSSIDRLMTTVDLPEGAVLTEQGSVGREFMILTEGTADVHVEGSGVVATLGAGDFLGELSILTGAKRNATVTATSAICAEVLNRRELAALFDDQPELARKVLLTGIKRLQAGENTNAS